MQYSLLPQESRNLLPFQGEAYFHPDFFSVEEAISFWANNMAGVGDFDYRGIIMQIPFTVCIFNERIVMPAKRPSAMIAYTI
jgi:hypothetical protein